jgi:vacuolar-type H+-ATPase subunit E/Vma4
MVNITNPPLPKFDTTSLNADLANKIKPPELQPIPDGSGNLRSMIKDQSKQLGTNIEGALDQFDKNVEEQAQQAAAAIEAEAKKLEEEARAAAKLIEEEFKRKKEEAKKAIEDAKKEAKEAYQKLLTAKEQAEDMIAKIKGYKIPRLKKLKPVPTKDLPAPPQFAKFMDADAKKEYSESVKSAETKGDPPGESLAVSKPEIKAPNYTFDAKHAGSYLRGIVFVDGVKILERDYVLVNYTLESILKNLKFEAKYFGFFIDGVGYPKNLSIAL